MRSLILIVHNVRSVHNVGSLLRTADSFGIENIIFSGYTPYPQIENDTRLPHIYKKLDISIAKTALGAERTVPYSYEDIYTAIERLKDSGYRIVALEQSHDSIPIMQYQPSEATALVIGEEVSGVVADIIEICDDVIEIPMFGKKESLNVSVAAGIALYQLRTA